MMVYAQDRRCICRASTSSRGRVPSTRKSRKGCAHDGATTTVRTAATTGADADDVSGLGPDATCGVVSVLELVTTAPRLQSTAPGAVDSEEPAAPGASECGFRSDALAIGDSIS